MSDLRSDPVAYWMDAAAAHREHAAKFAKTPEQVAYHESEALECERKAAEVTARMAFTL